VEREADPGSSLYGNKLSRAEVADPRAQTRPHEQSSACGVASPNGPDSHPQARLMRQGPLAGRYPAVAAMVTFALIPYLALSAALDPLVPVISADLHMSAQAMSLSSGLGNAAYAVGTVLAVQFAQHLPQRRMLLGYAVVLVVGSVLTASAQSAGMFIGGHVLQGLATSMLLIAAAPPLTIGFPRDKLRNTAVIMNM